MSHFASSFINQGTSSSSAFSFLGQGQCDYTVFSHWFLFLNWQNSVWLTLLTAVELALKIADSCKVIFQLA